MRAWVEVPHQRCGPGSGEADISLNHIFNLCVFHFKYKADVDEQQTYVEGILVPSSFE